MPALPRGNTNAPTIAIADTRRRPHPVVTTPRPCTATRGDPPGLALGRPRSTAQVRWTGVLDVVVNRGRERRDDRPRQRRGERDRVRVPRGGERAAGALPAWLPRLGAHVAAPPARAGRAPASAPSRRSCAATRPPRSPPMATYELGALVADAVALHEALGGDERAVLIGHDWGAEAAYGAARARARPLAPARDDRGPAARRSTSGSSATTTSSSACSTCSSSRRRTPTSVVAADDMAFLDRLWDDWSPGYDATEDLEHAKRCLREPANLAAALGYYRADEPGLHDGDPADRYAAEHAALSGRRPSRRCTSTATATAASIVALAADADRPPRARLAHGGHRGRRPLPPPRAARRGQRAHPALARVVAVAGSVSYSWTWRAASARQAGS